MSRFSPQQAIAFAGELLAGRYSGAEFAIASGSIVRGNGTATSDLDLVVIYPALKGAYREAFIHRGMPVEAFVNDYETIQGFIDREHRNGQCSMMHMLTTGVVVPGDMEASKRLQSYARTLLEAGPPAPDPAVIERLRYFVTDLIEDLRGQPPRQELCSILYILYQTIGELRLRQANMYVGTLGKHLARSLRACDPSFAGQLDDVMRAAHTGEFGENHIALVAALLETLGGRLFEGYHQDAPADVRTDVRWNVAKQ